MPSSFRRPAQPSSRPTSRPQTRVVAAVLATLLVVGVIAVGAVVLTQHNGSGTAARQQPRSGPCSAATPQLRQPQQFATAPPKSLAAGSAWTMTMHTNCGDIVAELDGAKAPKTVASFMFLAAKKYFDHTGCHRLTTSGIYVLQCGDPTGQGSGGPGYGFGVENAPRDGRYPAGTMAMARTSDPNSNGSQFFIVYSTTSLPDPTGYTVFGRVTKGLRIVRCIASRGATPGGDGRPKQPLVLSSVTVTRGAPAG
jgi:peptidyl-prolyl cis-trans isomerase B (cyclophilin B)